MITRQVIFEGRVQGVGFRYATKEIATGFDVCGWVKNLLDGTVEMQVQGDEEEVTDFLQEILENSPVAHHIQHHTVREIPPLERAKGFQIVS